MNESEKNIETCLPESILAEVASVPTDPQFVSLVNESLDPLKQQAVQQAGSDAYNEVVASHQPYTFTSQVAQMKSNLILLLRRFWRFPFGTGTLRSLSDMWQHYITRLQGSETYGIPSRLDQLTDLPSAPLLVADRKISDLGDCPDGISLAQILGNSNAPITEIKDTNHGWSMNKALPSFPNLEKLTLNCQAITSAISLGNALSNLTEASLPELETLVFSQGSPYFFYNCPNLETLNLPNWKTANYSWGRLLYKLPKLKVLNLPEFVSQNGDNSDMIASCDELEEVYMPKVQTLAYINKGDYGTFQYCPALKKVVFGKWPFIGYRFGGNSSDSVVYTQVPGTYGIFQQSPKLLYLDIGYADTNVHLNYWQPDSETLAHQQFLQNFRSFIVLRLANRKTTTALTLTLSANVYNAVTGANSGWASQHTLAELGITDNDLTDLETELGITSATIYATWLDTYTGANGIHWDINKAN